MTQTKTFRSILFAGTAILVLPAFAQEAPSPSSMEGEFASTSSEAEIRPVSPSEEAAEWAVDLSAATKGVAAEPSGIVGGYLYRGARQVAASVVVLPDAWMMIASILIHQAWLESRDLRSAVAEAKERLATGIWYDDTGTILSQAVRPVLDRIEERLQSMLFYRQHEAWAREVAPLMATGPACGYGDLSALLDGHDGDRLEARIRDIARQVTELLYPIERFATAPADERIPPQPHLGILIHGIRVFGE